MRLFSMPLIYMRTAMLASGIFTIGRFWCNLWDSRAACVSSRAKAKQYHRARLNSQYHNSATDRTQLRHSGYPSGFTAPASFDARQTQAHRWRCPSPTQLSEARPALAFHQGDCRHIYAKQAWCSSLIPRLPAYAKLASMP